MRITLIVALLIASVTLSNSFHLQSSRFQSTLSYRAKTLHMSENILMPALSSTMKEGKIVSWTKKVGDKVTSGDVLLVVESDKADMDVESYEDGYLASILVKEGESATVGAPVAVIVKSLDELKNIGSGPKATPVTNSAPAPAAAPPASTLASIPNVNYDKIFMPALSSTMKEGKIVSWTKKVGDKVTSGDVLLVVESDKADMDVESYEDGFLASILVKEGESAAVGAPVALVAKSANDVKTVQEYSKQLASGEAVASGSASSASAPASTPVPAAAAIAPAVVNDGRVAASGYAKAVAKEQGIDLKTVTPSRPDGFVTSKDLASGSASSTASAYVPGPGVINATPMARKYAAENNLDVTKIKGTGNFGRVTGDDVLLAAGKLQPKPAAAPPTASAAIPAAPGKPSTAPATETKVLDGVIAMDGMQKAVAKNMEKTLTVPIFRVTREIVTDKFDELYAQLKPKGVTVSALLAKAVAETLKKHPIINAAYVENGIKYNKDINVAMAVAIDGGLITPTIIKCSELDIFSIGRIWKDLVDRAKSKKLTPAEYSSGTFSISNLGMFGVSQFDAILPPGTGSILAISSSLPKVVQLKNGHFGVQKSMMVTITCDHRHIYGADAAQFLKDLAGKIHCALPSL
jgi:pyruvate dehydrogenase E2 component (dihydrolipoamide acetyltransferase)